jgi:YD repeat-containing protein
MKTTVRRASVALIAVALLASCGKKSETASPITRAAMPANHSLDFDTGFVADDLTHGIGAMQLTVARRWSGTDTLNTHFGSGWSDQNVIQLTLVSRNVILLWRGGVGWLTAHRNGEKLFEGDAGEKIEQTDKGWTAHMPHGGILTFDTNGRLISKKPAAGPACNYSYDKTGRLVSMGTGSGNELKYRNDKRGRVTRVDGPEGLRLEYSYDDKGRLAAVTNSRKVRTGYLYGDTGGLLAAQDEFGNQLRGRRMIQGIPPLKSKKVGRGGGAESVKAIGGVGTSL